jgi:hypothetical protein
MSKHTPGPYVSDQKLLAAAPELLEACQVLLHAEGAGIGTEYGNELLLKALDNARAALAKAQGERCANRRTRATPARRSVAQGAS